MRFAFQGEFHNPAISVDGIDNYRYVEMATPTPPGCQQPNSPNEDLGVDFYMIDTLITFTRPDSAVVYPSYQGHNQTVATRCYIDLELRVTFKGDSVPNCWVKVERPTLADSGGHSHGGARPMGRYNYAIASSDTADTVLARSDSHGKIKVRYVASQFGGVEQIRAKIVSTDTTKFDTLSMITRVPGLLPFPAPSSGNYELTGSKPAHRDNHYLMSQPAIDSLISAANKFRIAKWNSTGIMLLNDMSLPLGGLFDIDGAWRNPHRSHRVGRSVDIQNLSTERVDTVSPYTGHDTSFTIPKVKFVKDFVNFMKWSSPLA